MTEVKRQRRTPGRGNQATVDVRSKKKRFPDLDEGITPGCFPRLAESRQRFSQLIALIDASVRLDDLVSQIKLELSLPGIDGRSFL